MPSDDHDCWHARARTFVLQSDPWPNEEEVRAVATLLAAVAAEERAACAALCDAVVEEFREGVTWEPWTAGEAAKRIRARSDP